MGTSGEVIYFDAERGVGFASGTNGNRYVFDRSDLGGHAAVSKGARIEFRADGDRARDIVVRATTRGRAVPHVSPNMAGSPRFQPSPLVPPPACSAISVGR